MHGKLKIKLNCGLTLLENITDSNEIGIDFVIKFILLLLVKTNPIPSLLNTTLVVAKEIIWNCKI